MLGLLYKDFLSVKGKLFCIGLALHFILLVIVRFTFKEDDVIALAVYFLYIIFGLIQLPFTVDMALFKNDKTLHVKQYNLSMPISKEQYVREKYVFFLVTMYIVLSIGILEGQICKLFCKSDSQILVSLQSIESLLPALAGVILAIVGVEYMFIYALGIEKGTNVKMTLIVLIFMVVAVYMMFGDLALIDKINIIEVMEYVSKHPIVNMLVMIITPIVGGLIYFISYLFSVVCFKKKGDMWCE